MDDSASAHGAPLIGERTRAAPAVEATRCCGRRPLLSLSSVVVAIALVAFVLIRPDLPPQTTLASAQAEIAAGQVASVDIVGSTATITRKDGSRRRVEGLTAGAASGQGRLARAAILADVPVSAESGRAITLDLLANDVRPPLLSPLTAIVVAVWLIRRHLRPPVRPPA